MADIAGIASSYTRILVQGIVDDTSSIDITLPRSEDDDAIIVRIIVSPGDVGKLIGKKGRNAKALRAILHAFGMKYKKRVSLDIVEPSRATQHAKAA